MIHSITSDTTHREMMELRSRLLDLTADEGGKGGPTNLSDDIVNIRKIETLEKLVTAQQKMFEEMRNGQSRAEAAQIQRAISLAT